MWGNDLLSWLYDNLEEAYDAGEDYVIQKANQVADAAVASVQWIWEALQGDFNENMTTGQIAANAVLGVIPIVDQVLDCRDIIANCKKINEKPNDTWAWVALCLTIIGLIPSLGSVVKGVLKIIFLFFRKAGGDIATLVGKALKPIFAFLADSKIQKLLGEKGVYDILQEAVNKLLELKGLVNKDMLLSLFDEVIETIQGISNKISRIAPSNVRIWLQQAVAIVQSVRQKADDMIGAALAPLQDLLDGIAKALQDQIDQGHKAFPDAPNTHLDAAARQEVDPRIVKNAAPPLPDYHINNFLNREITTRQVDGTEIFYKYHGESNLMGRTHNYVTKSLYPNERILREELAILEEWGVVITNVTTFRPKAGTWIYEGLAAPQTSTLGDEALKGLGYQGLINVADLTEDTIISTSRIPQGF